MLERWATPRLTLVVGGPLGLHRSLIERADETWSLSPATFPHELVRVLVAEQLYRELLDAGVDACLDDRALRPGAKFKDLELLGLPVQVFVGRKAAEGQVEFLIRKGMDKSDCGSSEVKAKVLAALGR